MLQAERTYTRGLREQLLEWGWRSPSLSFGDADLVELGRRQVDSDPAEWGGGLQPDIPRLLRILSSVAASATEDTLLLDHDSVPAWRRKALARLLVTQAHAVAPEAVPEEHELLVPAAQREAALHPLERWSDSVALRPHLAGAIQDADPATGLAQASLTAGAFLSRAAEVAVFASVCSNLARHSGRELLEALAAQQPELTEHAASFWGDAAPDGQAIAWAEPARLSRASALALQAEHLLKPLPATVADDTAFYDRWAAYLPGWELPKLTPEMPTTHVGFILDYVSEVLHRELRPISTFGTLWQRWFAATLGEWSARDMRSITRTFSGLTNLIFPDGEMTKDDARLLLRLAIELRLRVRLELHRMSPREFLLAESLAKLLKEAPLEQPPGLRAAG